MKQNEPEEKKVTTPPLKPLANYHEIVMAALDTLRLHAPMEFINPNADRDHVSHVGDPSNCFIIHNINGENN